MNTKHFSILVGMFCVVLASCELSPTNSVQIPLAQDPKLNQSCTSDAQCNGLSHTVCRANKCQCAIGYLEYHKTLCRQEHCESDAVCGQLFGANTICKQYKCICKDGTVVDHDSQKCVVPKLERVARRIFPAKLVKPAVNNCKFGQLPAKSEKSDCYQMKCVDDLDCSYIFGQNTTCDWYSKTCKCDKFHKLNETTRTCSISLRHELNHKCAHDWQCGTTNAECRQERCQCKLGYKKGLGYDNCYPYYCASNQACHTMFGQNTKCGNSLVNGQNFCACDDSFTFDEQTKQCKPKSNKNALNTGCFASEECGNNALCVESQCQCQLGYVTDGNSNYNCRQLQCSSQFDCGQNFANSNCSFGSCSCSWEDGYNLDVNTQSCVPRSTKIGDFCYSDSRCGLGAGCVLGLCQCWSGKMVKPNQMDCQAATCTDNSDCELMDFNSKCSFSSCVCQDGYSIDYEMQKCTPDFTSDNYLFTVSLSMFVIFSFLSLCLMLISVRHRRAALNTNSAYVTSSAKISFPTKS